MLASIKATVKVYFKAAYTPAVKIFESTLKILFLNDIVYLFTFHRLLCTVFNSYV